MQVTFILSKIKHPLSLGCFLTFFSFFSPSMKYFSFCFCFCFFFNVGLLYLIFFIIFNQKKKKKFLGVNLHCQPLLLIPQFLKTFKPNLKITPMKIDISLLKHHSRLCSQISDLYSHAPQVQIPVSSLYKTIIHHICYHPIVIKNALVKK